jgi:hypothetical protein
MKEFKLYVGTDEDNMVEVLHSGLKNDSIPETFSIKHVNRAGICFPTRYVKVVPLSYVHINVIDVSIDLIAGLMVKPSIPRYGTLP